MADHQTLTINKTMTYYQKDTHEVPNDKIEQIVKLCYQKIQDQKDREKGLSYGIDDYNEGRIVGSASLARNILSLLGLNMY